MRGKEEEREGRVRKDVVIVHSREGGNDRGGGGGGGVEKVEGLKEVRGRWWQWWR